MEILELQAASHFISRDPEVQESEQSEFFQETGAFLRHTLSTQEQVEMVFQASTCSDLHPVKVLYCLSGRQLEWQHVISNLRFLRLKQSTLQQFPALEASSASMVVRRIRYVPVGSLTNVNDEELQVMPLMNQTRPNRAYLIPVARRLSESHRKHKWRSLLSSLAQSGGAIRLQIRKYTPASFEINYAAQALTYYRDTYEGKLSDDVAECHTSLYRAIVSQDDLFYVTIHVTGTNIAALQFAFLEDTDCDTFSFKDHEPPLRIGNLDSEEASFLHSLQHLCSLQEVIDLLIPPYTFQDALPGIKHEVYTPFNLPFVRRDPSASEAIVLGHLKDRVPVVLSPIDITRHMFVTGMNGSGKTHTVLNLLRQIRQSTNTPLLIFDPVKREYETLFHEFGLSGRIIDFRGDHFLRFNPLIPPPNICVYDHAAILARTLAILCPTNDVAYDTILNMVRQTYLAKLRSAFPQGVSLEDFLKVDGAFLRSHPECIPTFEEFLKAGLRWLKQITGYLDKNGNPGQPDRWGIEAVQYFERRWESMRSSIFMHIFSSSQPVDRYFESDHLIELYNVIDPDEKNTLFALMTALLNEYNLSRGLHNGLKVLTVLEEAHRIIPAHQPGLGENRVSSPAHEAATLISQMLAEARAMGSGFIVVDQSPSKVLPDVLINCATKIIHRSSYGLDKDTLGASLGLSSRERDHLSCLMRGEAIVFTPDSYQPAYIKVPE